MEILTLNKYLLCVKEDKKALDRFILDDVTIQIRKSEIAMVEPVFNLAAKNNKSEFVQTNMYKLYTKLGTHDGPLVLYTTTNPFALEE